MSFDRDAFLKRLAGVRAGVERRGLTMTGYRVRGDGVIVPDTKPRRRRRARAATAIPPRRPRPAGSGEPVLMAEPCPRCGTRGDVDCQHRPGEGAAPPAISNPDTSDDRRTGPKPGQGHNFRRRAVPK